MRIDYGEIWERSGFGGGVYTYSKTSFLHRLQSDQQKIEVYEDRYRGGLSILRTSGIQLSVGPPASFHAEKPPKLRTLSYPISIKVLPVKAAIPPAPQITKISLSAEI